MSNIADKIRDGLERMINTDLNIDDMARAHATLVAIAEWCETTDDARGAYMVKHIIAERLEV